MWNGVASVVFVLACLIVGLSLGARLCRKPTPVTSQLQDLKLRLADMKSKACTAHQQQGSR